MCDSDRWFGLVDMLTTCAGWAENIDPEFLIVDIQLDLLGFRQNGDCCCGGLYSSLRFGFRNSLNPMNSAFVFEARIRALSLYREWDFLYTAKLGSVGVYNLGLPPFCFSIHRIHSEKRICKQRGFLSACAGAYLYDNIARIVRVLWKEHYFNFVSKPWRAFFGFIILLLGHILKIFICFCMDDFVSFTHCLLRFYICAVSLYNRGKLWIFLHQIAVQGIVIDRFRHHQTLVYFIISIVEGWKLLKHLLSFLYSLLFSLLVESMLLTFFSAFRRGIMNSCPQPPHFSLKSMPERKTSILFDPHGCFFFIIKTSPLCISI